MKTKLSIVEQIANALGASIDAHDEFGEEQLRLFDLANAAPELLAACKRLIQSTVVNGQRFSCYPTSWAFARMETAIAKAEGAQ